MLSKPIVSNCETNFPNGNNVLAEICNTLLDTNTLIRFLSIQTNKLKHEFAFAFFVAAHFLRMFASKVEEENVDKRAQPNVHAYTNAPKETLNLYKWSHCFLLSWNLDAMKMAATATSMQRFDAIETLQTNKQ